MCSARSGGQGRAIPSCAGQGLRCELGSPFKAVMVPLLTGEYDKALFKTSIVFVLSKSLKFLFFIEAFVCVKMAAAMGPGIILQCCHSNPEPSSFHHTSQVSTLGALPQDRQKIFLENLPPESAQSYLITIILNAQ